MESSNHDFIYLKEVAPRQPRQKANAPVSLCPCCDEFVSRMEPHLYTCFFEYMKQPLFQSISFSCKEEVFPKYNLLPPIYLPQPTTNDCTKLSQKQTKENNVINDNEKLSMDEIVSLLKESFSHPLTNILPIPSDDMKPKAQFGINTYQHLPQIPSTTSLKHNLKINEEKSEEFNEISIPKSKPIIQPLQLHNLLPPSQNITINSAKKKSPKRTSPRSPRILSSSLTHSREYKKVEEKEKKNTKVEKVLDLFKEKRYSWVPNNNPLSAPLSNSGSITDDFRKMKKPQHPPSKKKDRQSTPFNLPLSKSVDMNITPSYDVTKLPIRTDVLSTKQLAEIYPEIDFSYNEVSEFPHNSRVAIICLENNCFVRLTEDGRVMADTPTAATHQLDVHFKLKKYVDQKKFKFKSVLWSKYLWHRVEFEAMNDYLLVRYKRSFTCLYMDPVTSEVKISVDKNAKSVFRVVKLFPPAGNLVSSASHMGLSNHLKIFEEENNNSNNNSNHSHNILSKQNSVPTTLKSTR